MVAGLETNSGAEHKALHLRSGVAHLLQAVEGDLLRLQVAFRVEHHHRDRVAAAMLSQTLPDQIRLQCGGHS